MKIRIISGVVGAAVFAAVIALQMFFQSFPVLAIALSLLAAMAAYELLYATGHMKNIAVVVAGMLAAAGIVLRIGGVLPVRLIYIVGAYAAVALIAALVKNKDIAPANVAFSLLAALAVGYSFACIVPLVNMARNMFYFWMLFICAWGSDTGAYFVGCALGKHKLAPVLSPKKTVEGLIGGIAVCIGLCIGLYFLVLGHAPNNWFKLIAAAAAFSVAGVVGDITASYIKRDAGIKDYGKL
ncbi:MAG: phosphatidate cytidylyltransferase, partial [Clostridia bacterium]|nr:phosphatidate cytidylyltransferase [Clostridia bacterium]